MPSLLKIRVGGAADLPVMDRQSELTDAYVEIRFADFDTQRSSICRKTLNPVWNEDFRFEISSDADLQNEPLEFKILDYDAITANDAVGTVVLDLNPLLAWDSAGQICGWFPIYDTLRGVRGQLHIQVKLQFFGDVNPFKESSAGVQFFAVPVIPEAVQVTSMHGFVDELIKDDDPEYHWSDSFRTPRSSNEARQRLLFRLSGQLRRLIGKKALELGGNAVVGYRQFFDLESEERSITARAIGTAVYIHRVGTGGLAETARSGASSPMYPKTPSGQRESLKDIKSGTEQPSEGNAAADVGNGMENLRSRRSSVSSEDSDTRSRGGAGGGASTIAGVQSIHHYMSVEPQIFTLHSMPPFALLSLGGIVTARSVKLIDNDDAEVRDAWWAELRGEIRSHARALGCPHVVGYSETTTINDELCVLSALGTAAVVDMQAFVSPVPGLATTNTENVKALSLSISLTKSTPNMHEQPDAASAGGLGGQGSHGPSAQQIPRTPSTHRPSYSSSLKDNFSVMELLGAKARPRKKYSKCRLCHIPYSRRAAPFPMSFVRCASCRKKYVPEIMIATIEPPPGVQTVGTGLYIEAHVCRAKKKKEGESNATIVSDALPFVEYDIHRQLLYKLRIQGMNAIFGLRINITVGDTLIVAVASGTALFFSALPAPPPLRISRNLDVIDEEDKKLLEIQKRIMDLSEANRREIEVVRQTLPAPTGESELDGRSMAPSSVPRPISPHHEGTADAGDSSSGAMMNGRGRHSGSMGSNLDTSDSDTDEEIASVRSGPTGGAVVQIDDDADEDLMAVLLDPRFGGEFQLYNTEVVPSHRLLSRSPPSPQKQDAPGKPVNSQLVTVVKQGSISMVSHHLNRQLSSLFRMLFEELRFRLSYFSPCVVAGIQVDVQLPKDYGVQIKVTALALGHTLADPGDDARSLRSSMVDGNNTPDYQISHVSSLASLECSGTRNMQDLWSAGGEAGRNSGVATTPAENSTTIPDDVISDAQMFHMDEENELGEAAGGLQRTSTLDTGTPAAPAADRSSRENLVHPRGNATPDQPAASSGTGGTRDIKAGIPLQLTRTNDSFARPPPPGSSAPFVDMSPLSFVPGCRVTAHLGTLSLHFVKEAHVSRETPTGGLGGFVHEFLAEVLAVVRAQVGGLGGNALVGLRVDQSLFEESIKSVGYGLVSVSGDVVEVVPEEPSASAARDGSWSWAAGRRR